jgi:hypothetical protein
MLSRSGHERNSSFNRAAGRRQFSVLSSQFSRYSQDSGRLQVGRMEDRVNTVAYKVSRLACASNYLTRILSVPWSGHKESGPPSVAEVVRCMTTAADVEWQEQASASQPDSVARQASLDWLSPVSPRRWLQPPTIPLFQNLGDLLPTSNHRCCISTNITNAGSTSTFHQISWISIPVTSKDSRFHARHMQHQIQHAPHLYITHCLHLNVISTSHHPSQSQLQHMPQTPSTVTFNTSSNQTAPCISPLSKAPYPQKPFLTPSSPVCFNCAHHTRHESLSSSSSFIHWKRVSCLESAVTVPNPRRMERWSSTPST